MLNTIKKELTRLAHQILAQEEDLSTNQVKEAVLELYQQLVILQHIENQQELSNIPQNNEVAPLMETINELVTELPLEEESAAINDLFASVSNPVFVKKEVEEGTKHEENIQEEETKKNLNDVLRKGIQIGLNDRLAFIKNLFEENAEDYQRVISQVQTCQSWEEAQLFIEQMIKPEYNNWEGKEAFEERFIKCLESNF